jgi:hypothetical protein
LNVLLPIMRDWFGRKRPYVECFARWDTRVEGWFKGEMLMLLEKMKQRRVIGSLERERLVHTPEGRLQIDFVIGMDDSEHLCEVKVLCTSQALRTPRNLRFYFREDGVGLIKDLRKLDSLESENCWAVAFVYPAPSTDRWREAIGWLPPDLSHWRCLTKPDPHERALFVGMFQRVYESRSRMTRVRRRSSPRSGRGTSSARPQTSTAAIEANSGVHSLCMDR